MFSQFPNREEPKKKNQFCAFSKILFLNYSHEKISIPCQQQFESHFSSRKFELNGIEVFFFIKNEKNSMQITTPNLSILCLGITTMSQLIHNCKQHEFVIICCNFVPKNLTMKNNNRD
jgi:hypothetical protein